MNKIFIVIPAFNESKVISSVIEEIKKTGYKDIIIVDDGSSDNTYKIAKDSGCIALRHMINRGKGAATQTGMDAARLLDADFIVTIDADGQHDPSQLKSVLQPLVDGECDIVLGSRLLGKNDMPLSRRVINKVGNFLTYLFYGLFVSDSQSGFRAYNKKANELIKTTFDRYEFESEVIHQIHLNKLRYKEIPISVRYTDYSLNKWKNLKEIPSQNFLNGFRMLFRMVIRSITT